MGRPSRFAPKVKTRAVRMVREHRPDYPSQWAAITSIAERFLFSSILVTFVMVALSPFVAHVRFSIS